MSRTSIWGVEIDGDVFNVFVRAAKHNFACHISGIVQSTPQFGSGLALGVSEDLRAESDGPGSGVAKTEMITGHCSLLHRV